MNNSRALLASDPGGFYPYAVQYACRGDSARSTYFNRTPASSGSRTTLTVNAWVKRTALGASNHIINAGTTLGDGANRSYLQFLNTDTLSFADSVSSTVTSWVVTNAVFRDTSSWYNVHLVWDTTNATAGDRVRLYVNGTRITSFSTANNPALNAQSFITHANVHTIGVNITQTAYSNLLYAAYNVVDGLALEPTAFGTFASKNSKVWVPIAPVVSNYGTTGFNLNFANASALGTDVSGKGNTFTSNNFTTTDQLLDTPTNNYCVMSQLDSCGTISGGGLTATFAAAWQAACGTMVLPANSRTYYEGKVTSLSNGVGVGLVKAGLNGVDQVEVDSYRCSFETNTSTSFFHQSGFGTDPVGSYTKFSVNDVIGVAADTVNGSVAFYRNNSLIGTVTNSVLTTEVWKPYCNGYSSACVMNFGQTAFAYTPPAGYKALCSGNLPEPAVINSQGHFATFVYTGNGTTQNITTFSFSPGLVFTQALESTNWPGFWDVLRGATNSIYTCSTVAETTEAQTLTSFLSNGFSVGTAASINENGKRHVAHGWKLGSSAINSVGSIQSTVAANQAAGISVVSYTGTGVNASIGHGLTTTPKMIIVKRRNSAKNWAMCHIGTANANWYMLLSTTDAQIGDATVFVGTPQSTYFWVGTNSLVNGSTDTYIAYCFAEMPGFSAIGSYIGNGSADGTFVNCGFRPAYVVFKRFDVAGDNWNIRDAARDIDNVVDRAILYNESGPESGPSPNLIDFVSNGFKHRGTASGGNIDSGTYLYAAFAEQPFKYANSR